MKISMGKIFMFVSVPDLVLKKKGKGWRIGLLFIEVLPWYQRIMRDLRRLL